MNENIIYVILHNGKLHLKCGTRTRKAAYLTEGSAKAVVTSDVEQLARARCEENGGEWWSMDGRVRNFWISEVRKEFQIVPYGPMK